MNRAPLPSQEEIRAMRDRRWGHLGGAPPPAPSPWAVPWHHHNDFTDLYYEDHTRHFLLRTRVTPESIGKLRKLVECMQGIFDLPEPRPSFAWPVLDNTWGTP